MPVIKLQSSDGKVFDTDIETAKCSSTIKTLLEDCPLEAENDTLIPLPNVNSAILKKVLTWAEHHPEDSEEEHEGEAARPMVQISAWDAEFLAMDQGSLFELILAANYLDMRNLLNAACMTVANMIKGHTAEEIRQTFHIANDFSPSEEDLLPVATEAAEEEDESTSTVYGDI